MNNLNVEQGVVDRFVRLNKAGRLAHAYLFVGPDDELKLNTAVNIACAVNCEDQHSVPCGVCGACKKIAANNHPDVYLLGQNEEGAISIDDIRQMLGRVALRSFEANVKVFILPQADVMRKETANALLKTLEEPAANTLMILTTHAPQNCLDTIKSRCHQVNFVQAHDALPQQYARVLDLFLAKGSGEEFVKELSADTSRAGDAMQVLLAFVRDAALYRSGISEKYLVFQSRLRDIQELSYRGMDDLSALSAQIVRTKKLANEKLNVKMALSLVRQRLWGN